MRNEVDFYEDVWCFWAVFWFELVFRGLTRAVETVSRAAGLTVRANAQIAWGLWE